MSEDKVKQVIVVRKDLNMRKGKMCAQVAHASMKFLLENNESPNSTEILTKLSVDEADWVNGIFTKIVLGCDSEGELKELVLQAQLKGIEVHEIIDSGLTEFHDVPTLTCAAFGPGRSTELNEVTGHLKTL